MLHEQEAASSQDGSGGQQAAHKQEAAQPIDIEGRGPSSKYRYRSPDQIALSPRSTMRNMLASELSISLRQQMMWERRQGAVERLGRSEARDVGEKKRRSHSV